MKTLSIIFALLAFAFASNAQTNITHVTVIPDWKADGGPFTTDDQCTIFTGAAEKDFELGIFLRTTETTNANLPRLTTVKKKLSIKTHWELATNIVSSQMDNPRNENYWTGRGSGSDVSEIVSNHIASIIWEMKTNDFSFEIITNSMATNHWHYELTKKVDSK